ncbi:MAG: hypothetical protein MJY45_07605 [Bacteroidales bacterium]|nr:hypothetical protein [Bacteroidales bacterium]
MKTFFAAAILIGLGVFGMCFNVIFRKNGKFPEYEVGENEEMKKRGIRCASQEDDDAPSRKNERKKLNCNESCSNCRETECR